MATRFNRNHLLGRLAEMLACFLLWVQGWAIVRTNHRINGIEVDILARRGKTVLVAEVKARQTWQSAEMALRYSQSSRQAKVQGHLQSTFPEHRIVRQTIYMVGQWPFVRTVRVGED